MSIRILGGKHKGLVINVPTQNVRPTAVMLKRRVFDSRQRLEGHHFFDLCAGSGAVGLEALSRGAESVCFVEFGNSQIKIIENNLSLFREQAKQAVVKKINVVSWVKSYLSTLGSSNNHILFFDPPYDEKKVYLTVLQLLFNDNLFEGELWLEVDLRQEFLEELSPFLDNYSDKKFVHGAHAIYILKRS